MWFALLGCSLPEPTPDASADYERRDPPSVEDDGTTTADSGDDGPVADTADTSVPTKPVFFSGDLLVSVSDASDESTTCEGQVELSVTEDDIHGYGNCLLTTGGPTSSNELELEFDGDPDAHGGPGGPVHAEADHDSFVTA